MAAAGSFRARWIIRFSKKLDGLSEKFLRFVLNPGNEGLLEPKRILSCIDFLFQRLIDVGPLTFLRNCKKSKEFVGH